MVLDRIRNSLFSHPGSPRNKIETGLGASEAGPIDGGGIGGEQVPNVTQSQNSVARTNINKDLSVHL